MRIHIALVGVNRALSQTAESLIRELTPKYFSRSAISWSLTLIEPKGNLVQNPRARESGELESRIPDELAHIPIHRMNQEKIDVELSKCNYERVVGSSEWSAHPESVKNLFRFLFALNETFEQIVRPKQPDFVIFCRPDLRIIEPLRIDRLLFLAQLLTPFRPSVALLPSWGRSRGLNDRFAILSHAAVKPYFCRLLEWEGFFTSQPTANAEKLLAHALSESLVLNSIHTAMVRLRIGHAIDSSDSAMLRKNRLQRRLGIYSARSRRLGRQLKRSVNYLREHFR